MKRSRWIPWAMALGINGWLVGCDRAAPTEPGGGLVHIDEAAVNAPVSGLSGAWAGTITFLGFDDGEGNSVIPPCDGASSITVTLNQDGDSLTGQFQSCAGLVAIRGMVFGTEIAGSLDGATGQGYGKISGTVSANRIRFRTTQGIDNAPRDHDGDEVFTSSRVDLHRVQRMSPVAVGGARSPRVLPSRR